MIVVVFYNKAIQRSFKRNYDQLAICEVKDGRVWNWDLDISWDAECLDIQDMAEFDNRVLNRSYII